MSLFIDCEEEMDFRRDDAYKQIEILVKQPAKYLSAFTKKALRAHLANFNFGYEWTDEGEELLRKTMTERMVEAERILRGFEEELLNMLYVDDEVDKLFDLAEYWESALSKPYESVTERSNRVMKAQNKRDDLRSKPIKRDKHALWASRVKPTRHKQIKLAKRQPDPQPAQQTE